MSDVYGAVQVDAAHVQGGPKVVGRAKRPSPSRGPSLSSLSFEGGDAKL